MKSFIIQFFIYFFCYSFISTSVHCNEILSLSRCIDIGLSNAYSIKKQQNSLILNKSQMKSAFGNLLPSLEVGITYLPYNKSYQQLIDMPQLLNPQNDNAYKYYTSKTISNDANYFIRGSLTLFDGLASLYKIKSSLNSFHGSELLLKREKEQFIYEILKLYYQLMLDKEIVKIANENLLLSTKLLTKISAKVAVGDLSVADQYQQEAKVSEFKLFSIKKNYAVDIDKLNIINKIGISYNYGSFEFENIVLPQLDNTEEINKDELITKALINRSDFLAKKSFVNAYKQNINISKADMFPKINLITQLSSISTDVTSYSLNNTKYDINNQTNVFDLLFKNTNFLYGFELKWKIFDGFTTNSNIQKSKLEYLNSIIELDEIKNRIFTEIQILVADYNSCIYKIKETNSGLIAANHAFATVSERYNLGLSDFAELADAQATLLNAKSERVQALYNMDFQTKIVSFYTGLLNQSGYTLN